MKQTKQVSTPVVEQNKKFDINNDLPLFLGYKLAPCNAGKAWVSPFKYAVDDVLKIHGTLDRHVNLSHFQTDWSKINMLVDWIEKEHSCTVTISKIYTEISPMLAGYEDVKIVCGGSRLKHAWGAIEQFTSNYLNKLK